jgi:aromatic ring-opening dioxygenase LigB subunit
MSLNKLYLTDRFTLDSINQFPFYLTVYKFNEEDFCETVRGNKELTNRLYRKASVRLLNYLCGVSLKVNKSKITLNPGDVAFLINFSNSKIAVIDKEHAMELVKNGKVQFYEVIV